MRRNFLSAVFVCALVAPAFAGETLEIPVPKGWVKIENGATTKPEGPVPPKLVTLFQKKPQYIFGATLPEAFKTGKLEVMMLVDKLEKGRKLMDFSNVMAKKTLEAQKDKLQGGESLVEGKTFPLEKLKGVLTIVDNQSNRKYQYLLQHKGGSAYIVTFSVPKARVPDYGDLILKTMGDAIESAGK